MTPEESENGESEEHPKSRHRRLSSYYVQELLGTLSSYLPSKVRTAAAVSMFVVGGWIGIRELLTGLSESQVIFGNWLVISMLFLPIIAWVISIIFDRDGKY